MINERPVSQKPISTVLAEKMRSGEGIATLREKQRRITSELHQLAASRSQGASTRTYEEAQAHFKSVDEKIAPLRAALAENTREIQRFKQAVLQEYVNAKEGSYATLDVLPKELHDIEGANIRHRSVSAENPVFQMRFSGQNSNGALAVVVVGHNLLNDNFAADIYVNGALRSSSNDFSMSELLSSIDAALGS